MNKRILIIYYGDWPSYDNNDVHRKWNQMVEGPLRSYGNNNHSIIYVGRTEEVEREDLDRLFHWIRHWQPDVILWAVHGNGIDDYPMWYENIWASFHHSARIFSLWIDCTTDGDIKRAEAIAPYVHGIINVDRDESPRYTKDPSKYINMPCGYGRQWFYDPHIERKYPLTFIGEWIDRPERKPIIETIRKHGIELVTSDQLGLNVPGDHAGRSPITMYAHALQESVMTLNIPPHPTYPILNGRIWEGMACGACIVNIDYPGSPMMRIFEPNVDYISILDEGSLVNVLKKFINDMDQAKIIANHGSESYWRKYSPEKFWHTLCTL
jgi:hypothetical protein